jgi:hypothetical protein
MMYENDFCCEEMLQVALGEKKAELYYNEYQRCYYIESRLIEKRSPLAAHYISYCPWCGTALPTPLIKEWVNTVIEAGYEKCAKEGMPKEFQTDEWWRKRGLDTEEGLAAYRKYLEEWRKVYDKNRAEEAEKNEPIAEHEEKIVHKLFSEGFRMKERYRMFMASDYMGQWGCDEFDTPYIKESWNSEYVQNFYRQHATPEELQVMDLVRAFSLKDFSSPEAKRLLQMLTKWTNDPLEAERFLSNGALTIIWSMMNYGSDGVIAEIDFSV